MLEHLEVGLLVLSACFDRLGQHLVVERVERLVRRLLARAHAPSEQDRKIARSKHRTHLDVHEHVSVRDAELAERLLVRQLLALVQQQDELGVPRLLRVLLVLGLPFASSRRQNSAKPRENASPGSP